MNIFGRTRICAHVRRAVLLAIGASSVLLATTPASALSFVFTTVANQVPTNDEIAAFQTAANVWSSYLTDNITVNIKLGATQMTGNQSNVLASTSAALVGYTPTTVQNRLTADAASADDAKAVANLGTISGNLISMTTANARALGLTPSGTTDATITLNSAYTYSDSRAADGTVAAGTYDLVGIAEHEIGHALGFISDIDDKTGYSSVLDLFRYSASGQRITTTGPAYFSIDGGQTQIASFADGVSDQASHWKQGTNGVMAPEASPGQTENITSTDLRAMDVIGYNLASVPEPATWSMMILGFGAVGAALRRRRETLAHTADSQFS